MNSRSHWTKRSTGACDLAESGTHYRKEGIKDILTSSGSSHLIVMLYCGALLGFWDYGLEKFYQVIVLKEKFL